MFRRRHRYSLHQRAIDLVWPRIGWRRWASYVGHRIGRLRASPHAIAAGFASGAAVSMTPFIGLHFLLGFGVAWMTRGSMVAAAIGTVVGNPWTFPFIWYLSYAIGSDLLGRHATESIGESLSVAAFFDDPSALFVPMLLGGALMALVAWPAFYFAVRIPVALYRRRRELRRRRAGDVMQQEGVS